MQVVTRGRCCSRPILKFYRVGQLIDAQGEGLERNDVVVLVLPCYSATAMKQDCRDNEEDQCCEDDADGDDEGYTVPIQPCLYQNLIIFLIRQSLLLTMLLLQRQQSGCVAGARHVPLRLHHWLLKSLKDDEDC